LYPVLSTFGEAAMSDHDKILEMIRLKDQVLSVAGGF